jgi:gas vesicle protein
MSDLRSSEFLLGALMGSLLGASVGLLLAPQSGQETRELIKERAYQLLEVMKEKCPYLQGPKEEKEEEPAASEE